MKTHLISFLQTFSAVFLSALGVAVASISPETMTDPETYTSSFFISLVVSAVRVAVKSAWGKVMPEVFGGKAKE